MTQYVIPAVIGAALGLLGMLAGRPKMKADAAASIVTSALGIISDLEARIKNLENRIDELEARDRAKGDRIDELESGVQVLSAQVLELGHYPRWPVDRATLRQGD